MNEVIVRFFGICTHMEPKWIAGTGASPSADWGRRVVLVNASSQDRIDSYHQLREKQIKPHFATLQIAVSHLPAGIPSEPWFPMAMTDDFAIWRLEGVTMTVRNAVPALTANERGNCIPHLVDYVPEHHLPEAGPAASSHDPELAACYFDFPHSPFSGGTLSPTGKGAGVGVLNVQVSGEPVLIDVESFVGKGKVTIPVRPGSQISLANIPVDGKTDTDSDFLLHYLVCKDFPQGATFPTMAPCTGVVVTDNVPVHYDSFTGPGCSNSNYP